MLRGWRYVSDDSRDLRSDWLRGLAMTCHRQPLETPIATQLGFLRTILDGYRGRSVCCPVQYGKSESCTGTDLGVVNGARPSADRGHTCRTKAPASSSNVGANRKTAGVAGLAVRRKDQSLPEGGARWTLLNARRRISTSINREHREPATTWVRMNRCCRCRRSTQTNDIHHPKTRRTNGRAIHLSATSPSRVLLTRGLASLTRGVANAPPSMRPPAQPPTHRRRAPAQGR